MKLNFEAMSKAELKAYVLKHRDDIEAIRFLFRVPAGVAVKRYPPVCTEEGVPIEENIRLMEEAIQEIIAREKNDDYQKARLITDN